MVRFGNTVYPKLNNGLVLNAAVRVRALNNETKKNGLGKFKLSVAGKRCIVVKLSCRTLPSIDQPC